MPLWCLLYLLRRELLFWSSSHLRVSSNRICLLICLFCWSYVLNYYLVWKPHACNISIEDSGLLQIIISFIISKCGECFCFFFIIWQFKMQGCLIKYKLGSNFTDEKLWNFLTSQRDKKKFNKWGSRQHIILY